MKKIDKIHSQFQYGFKAMFFILDEKDDSSEGMMMKKKNQRNGVLTVRRARSQNYFLLWKPSVRLKHSEERYLDLERYLPHNKTVSLKKLYIKP